MTAQSQMLFFAAVDVFNRKATTNDILRKLLYAEDLVADIEADLQERLVEWKEIFGRH